MSLYIYFAPIYLSCTTIHRYPVFSTRNSVMCKVYTGYCGTIELEHGLCACTVNNPLAKARGLSLRTGTHTVLYLSLEARSCTPSLNKRYRNVNDIISQGVLVTLCVSRAVAVAMSTSLSNILFCLNFSYRTIPARSNTRLSFDLLRT